MALPKRYVTCPKCGKTLEQNKSNFTWSAYPKDNKRCHEICKNCEETQLYRELKLEIIEILGVQNVKLSKIKLKEKNIQMKKN